jgi:hypothetical protein
VSSLTFTGFRPASWLIFAMSLPSRHSDSTVSRRSISWKALRMAASAFDGGVSTWIRNTVLMSGRVRDSVGGLDAPADSVMADPVAPSPAWHPNATAMRTSRGRVRRTAKTFVANARAVNPLAL